MGQGISLFHNKLESQKLFGAAKVAAIVCSFEFKNHIRTHFIMVKHLFMDFDQNKAIMCFKDIIKNIIVTCCFAIDACFERNMRVLAFRLFALQMNIKN